MLQLNATGLTDTKQNKIATAGYCIFHNHSSLQVSQTILVGSNYLHAHVGGIWLRYEDKSVYVPFRGKYMMLLRLNEQVLLHTCD